MASFDLKLIFIAIAILVFSYQTEVNQFSDEFTISVNRSFSTCRNDLYKFVTNPHLLYKWVDWVFFFMSADHKPLKVGKVFKAVLDSGIVQFKVTDFDEEKYLALESNFLLRPRLEISFFEISIASKNHRIFYDKRYALSRLHIRLIFRRSSALFQYTIGTVLRMYLKDEVKRFLRNLETVMTRISMFPRRSYHFTDENNMKV